MRISAKQKKHALAKCLVAQHITEGKRISRSLSEAAYGGRVGPIVYTALVRAELVRHVNGLRCTEAGISWLRAHGVEVDG